jgi:DNA repair protein RecO (recombination protein O)
VSRYRTRSGIVLRRSVTPAGDVILVIFTPEGKMRGVARSGVKGSRSPRLNLFQHLTIQTYERPGNDLPTITQIVLEGALVGLSKPEVYPYAHLLAELADKLYQEADHVGQTGFELLAGGLRGLVRHEDPDRVALIICWKLLAASGLYPRVHACIETGEMDNLRFFDAQAGGVIASDFNRGMDIGEEAIFELARISRGTVREVLEDDLDPEARLGLWRALEAYLTIHVSELRAWAALRLQRHSTSSENTNEERPEAAIA